MTARIQDGKFFLSFNLSETLGYCCGSNVMWSNVMGHRGACRLNIQCHKSKWDTLEAEPTFPQYKAAGSSLEPSNHSPVSHSVISQR